MSTTFNNTRTVAEFKAATGSKVISIKRSASGKPYATTDNGIDIKMSAAAELALSDPATASQVCISECADEEKSFFMLHVKNPDNGTTLFTI